VVTLTPVGGRVGVDNWTALDIGQPCFTTYSKVSCDHHHRVFIFHYIIMLPIKIIFYILLKTHQNKQYIATLKPSILPIIIDWCHLTVMKICNVYLLNIFDIHYSKDLDQSHYRFHHLSGSRQTTKATILTYCLNSLWFCDIFDQISSGDNQIVNDRKIDYFPVYSVLLGV